MNWREREKQQARKQLETETYEKDAALWWSSVDRPVPLHVFKAAEIEPPPAQGSVIAAHTERVLSEYREAMKDHVHSPEELAEMRANFGPGATVVNVITGKKTKL